MRTRPPWSLSWIVVVAVVACGDGLGPLGPRGPAGPTPELRTSASNHVPVIPAVSVQAAATVRQLDVTFDDGAHPDSPWGEVLVDFLGTGPVLYFNLTWNGVWRVRNMPVLSREGAAVAQAVTFLFDLGVADGTDVVGGTAAHDLTTAPLAGAPAGGSAVSVGTRNWAINTGIRRREIEYAQPAPLLSGGQAIGNRAAHRGFPNQQANMNECVPAALSNSLQWMNTAFGLGLAADQISIGAMKVLTRWNTGGAPQQWWSRKRSQFKELIATSTIPKRRVDRIHNAVARGCDVEININNHVVAVTGSQQLADGRYAFDLTHDPNQKDNQAPGAEGTQTVTWDPATKKFSGAPWLEGRQASLIVMECSKRQT